jgi:hypothetical protein
VHYSNAQHLHCVLYDVVPVISNCTSTSTVHVPGTYRISTSTVLQTTGTGRQAAVIELNKHNYFLFAKGCHHTATNHKIKQHNNIKIVMINKQNN